MVGEIKLIMNKERLELIVKNMESLVNALKLELKSDDTQIYKTPLNKISDYDEVFEEDC
jgi:hypothetical protein